MMKQTTRKENRANFTSKAQSSSHTFSLFPTENSTILADMIEQRWREWKNNILIEHASVTRTNVSHINSLTLHDQIKNTAQMWTWSHLKPYYQDLFKT